MDSSIIYSLGLGMQVNIKRTDGRVHTAVVSGINWESKSITVEWFERSETKGKEVDLESIVALNPHIVARNEVNEAHNTTTNLHVHQPAVARHTIINNEMRPPPAEVAPSVTKSQIPAGNDLGSSNSVAHRNIGNRIPKPRQVTMLNAPVPKSIDNEDKMEIGSGTNINGTTGPGGTVTRESNMGPPASRRRSNVVKEVEKLKKNREERRMRQHEAKQEKENLMNVDPGNPNWEFLSMIRDYRNTIDFNPLKDSDPIEDHQITVCVRKRPMNKKENNRKEVDVVSVPNKNQIVVHEPKQKVDLTKYLENQKFRFDYSFDETCSNEKVYKYSARPLVQTIFEGGMATCFAYGQTGSGKTHTMGGDFNGKTQSCEKGIYAMTAKDVFNKLNSPQFKHLKLDASCSFFEIYSGKVFDLLANKTKLRVLEDGKQQVQVVGLQERTVDSVEDVLKLIQLGNAARTSGQTSANSNSSRSHAVFQIILRQGVRLYGKFSLIDLAGNERGADTSSADRQTRMEGAEINKSLLALKECIRALGRKGAHLPFRASKLTQVLRDSFIGEKSKTCMIAMISPGLSSCEHSLNTLRYADRVKELAATDPAEMKMTVANEDDDDVENMESESDLAQLRSLNEGEMSGEMLHFHEAMSKLQEAEDEIVEFHKGVVESNPRWHKQDMILLNTTNQVEYDQDAYCTQLESLIVEKMNSLTELRNKVCKFRNMLNEEEAVSKYMSNNVPNLRR